MNNLATQLSNMPLIPTTIGDRPPSALHMAEGVVENDNEYTEWVEFRQSEGGEIIHRSAHVRLKQPVMAFPAAGSF